jgi:hypothetical protein
MSDELVNKAWDYYEDYFLVCTRPSIITSQKYYSLPKFMQIISKKVYKIPMTKDEFFEDRPWLEKDEKLYDEYLKEDIRLKVEMRKEKIAFWKKYSLEEVFRLFIAKKNN